MEIGCLVKVPWKASVGVVINIARERGERVAIVRWADGWTTREFTITLDVISGH